MRSSMQLLHHSATERQVPVAAAGVDCGRGGAAGGAGCARDYADWAGHDLLRRGSWTEGWAEHVAGRAGGSAGAEVAAILVCVSEQGDDSAAGDDCAARHDCE